MATVATTAILRTVHSYSTRAGRRDVGIANGEGVAKQPDRTTTPSHAAATHHGDGLNGGRDGRNSRLVEHPRAPAHDETSLCQMAPFSKTPRRTRNRKLGDLLDGPDQQRVILRDWCSYLQQLCGNDVGGVPGTGRDCL